LTVVQPDRGPAPASPRSALPLAVDLDGTLLATDTLFEAIAAQLRTQPLLTLWLLLCLPFSIARVKRRLQGAARIDVATLPVNDAVAAYVRRAKEQGRPVWLVSAADQSVVDAAAARFGTFDRAVGSNGAVNNKGSAKARLLQEAFPQGFEYIGDSPADMKVWRAAAAASHVGGGPARSRRIEAMGRPVAAAFERKPGGFKAWRKALRLHQWAKNLLIFVAPVLALAILDPAVFIKLVAAFVLMGLVASGTYVVNDLLDLDADRRHHSKQKRPFASGALKLWQGFLIAPLLILAGLGGAAVLSTPFAVTLVVYLALTLSYSLFLKRVALLDVLVLAFLYTLRLIMGGVLAGVPVTEWLLVFSMFLFVSLSLAKRHVEVGRKAAAGERLLANRGYRADDAPLTLGLGLAAAAASPLIMVLYLMASAWPSGLYVSPNALWAAPVILSLWLSRIWLLANRLELDDDPVTFAVKDSASLLLGALLGAAFLLAVTGSPVSLNAFGLGALEQARPDLRP
jgi:4-hydroxybenzoate polyprenyltransferase/phosphoserine phosphatase